MQVAGRRVRKMVAGTDIRVALQRCIQVGVAAAVARAATDRPEEDTLLADILEAFFKEPDTGREMAKLLSGECPNPEELTEIFRDTGMYPINCLASVLIRPCRLLKRHLSPSPLKSRTCSPLSKPTKC